MMPSTMSRPSLAGGQQPVFRLFVSSTFADFVAERHVLHGLFPGLVDLCARHGARFEAVDLRWGIGEADVTRHRTLDVCLAEVQRCQQLTPRPNFLLLLGDRYGWRPIPAAIPEPEWQTLLPLLTRRETLLFERYYAVDPMLLPPAFRLKPRAKRLERRWPLAERLMRATLDRVMDRLAPKLPSDAVLAAHRYSATHREAQAGALEDTNLPHLIAFHRGITDLPAAVTPRSAGFTDWSHDGRREGLAKTLLGTFVGEVAACAGEFLRVGVTLDETARAAEWAGHARPGDSTGYLETFRAWAEGALTRQITAEITRYAARSPSVREAEAHAAFGATRRIAFTGRADIVRQVADYLASPGEVAPRVLRGPVGSGKSALLAMAMEQAARGGAPVVMRFAGITAASGSFAGLLADLSAQAPPSAEPATASPAEALRGLLDRLDVPLVIDGLDQLPDRSAEALVAKLRRMTLRRPLVVSLRSDRVAGQEDMHLTPPGEAEIGAMLDAWLAAGDPARRLATPLRAAMLRALAVAPSPLAVRLAALQPDGATPDQALPTALEGWIRLRLEGLTRDFPEALTSCAVGALALSRYGLADDEMLAVLSEEPAVRAEFDANRRHEWRLEGRAMPPIYWARLRAALAPVLVEGSASGAAVTRFFHHGFAEAVIAWLDTRAPGLAGHLRRHLGSTFADLLRVQEPWSTPAPQDRRTVLEAPWQLARAGDQAGLAVLLNRFPMLLAKVTAGELDDLQGDLPIGDPEAPTAELANWVHTTLPWLRDAAPSHHGPLLLQLVRESGPALLATSAESWAGEHGLGARLVSDQPRPGRLPAYGSPEDTDAAMVGGRMLTWDSEGTIRVWDAASQAHLCDAPHGMPLSGVAAGPEGQFWSWTSDAGEVTLWRPMPEKQAERRPGYPLPPLNSALGLADGRLLCLGRQGGLWLLDDKAPGLLAPDDAGVAERALHPLPDGRVVLTSRPPLEAAWSPGLARFPFSGAPRSVPAIRRPVELTLLTPGREPCGTPLAWDGDAWPQAFTALADGTVVAYDIIGPSPNPLPRPALRAWTPEGDNPSSWTLTTRVTGVACDGLGGFFAIGCTFGIVDDEGCSDLSDHAPLWHFAAPNAEPRCIGTCAASPTRPGGGGDPLAIAIPGGLAWLDRQGQLGMQRGSGPLEPLGVARRGSWHRLLPWRDGCALWRDGEDATGADDGETSRLTLCRPGGEPEIIPLYENLRPQATTDGAELLLVGKSGRAPVTRVRSINHAAPYAAGRPSVRVDEAVRLGKADALLLADSTLLLPGGSADVRTNATGLRAAQGGDFCVVSHEVVPPAEYPCCSAIDAAGEVLSRYFDASAPEALGEGLFRVSFGRHPAADAWQTALWWPRRDRQLPLLRPDAKPFLSAGPATLLSDGLLVIGAADGSLCGWETHSGQPVGAWPRHAAEIHGLQPLTDGDLLSWSTDGEVVLGPPGGIERRMPPVAAGRILHANLVDGEVLAVLVAWDGADQSMSHGVLLLQGEAWAEAHNPALLHALRRAAVPPRQQLAAGWMSLEEVGPMEPGVIRLDRGPGQPPLHWIAPEPLAGGWPLDDGAICAIGISGTQHRLTLAGEGVTALPWPASPAKPIMRAAAAAQRLDTRLDATGLGTVERGMAALGRWRLRHDAPLVPGAAPRLAASLADWLELGRDHDAEAAEDTVACAEEAEDSELARRVAAGIRDALADAPPLEDWANRLLLLALALQPGPAARATLFSRLDGTRDAAALDRLEASLPAAAAGALRGLRDDPAFRPLPAAPPAQSLRRSMLHRD